MSEEKIYELKQDIWTPVYFIRAGKRATESQWKARLGEFDMKWCGEWFYNLSELKEEKPIDELNELIDAIFKNNRLNSMSYKDAAREIAQLWLKQNQSK